MTHLRLIFCAHRAIGSSGHPRPLPVARPPRNSDRSYRPRDDAALLLSSSLGLAAFCAVVEASQQRHWLDQLRETSPLARVDPAHAASWVIIALLTPAVLYLARRFPIDRGRWRVSLAVHLLGATAFAFAHLGGTAVFYATWDGSYAVLPLLLNKFIPRISFSTSSSTVALWGRRTRSGSMRKRRRASSPPRAFRRVSRRRVSRAAWSTQPALSVQHAERRGHHGAQARA